MRSTLSELRQSLSRNKSMSISLIVTMTVSLLLAASGLLILAQSDRTEKYLGDRLQLQVNLCTKNSPSANCIGGVATAEQKTAIEEAMRGNSQVKSFDERTPAEQYESAKAKFGQSETGRRQLETISPESFPSSYFVTLNDPQKYDSVESQLGGMQGVGSVISLKETLGPLFTALDKPPQRCAGDLGAPGRRGSAAGLQHDPDDCLRAAPRDRHHAARRCGRAGTSSCPSSSSRCWRR
ncbi:cell division protein FtsX [Aeromicrobium sp. UC242_57]|uniref:cell division protein FtsX n=1 Tax=Aeromicrobium sp. UC242_57 TaxID=3374624 RepID=UPI003787BE1A